VLNFEARGSSGPSYMLMETNGNAGLVKNLQLQMPLSSIKLLMYSIYKMLPNDTDLTFLESKAIFRVTILLLLTIITITTRHKMTANHLDKNTLAHQGSYLMPLLNISNADLSTN
jgi:hypothetical protein